MQNLIFFFIRNNAFFVFAFFELFAVYLLVNNNEKQGQVWLSSANSVAGGFYAMTNKVLQYKNLATVNKQLIDENAKLKEQQESSYFSHKIDTQLIKDKVYQQQYRYTTASVVNNSISRQNNFLTLDRGAAQGIKVNSGVVSAAGVVGIVTKVSDNYAVVMSMLNRNSRISAKLSRTGYFGQLVWNGSDPNIMVLTEISKQAKIKMGDSVVTSGYSSMFPANIYVGKVRKQEVASGSAFYTIYVELAADLGKLEHVFVVDNIFRKEAEALEEAAKVTE
jgi:rod shape-determining protein MreC